MLSHCFFTHAFKYTPLKQYVAPPMPPTSPHEKISFDVPRDHLEKLRQKAKENDTDLSKLLRLIIKIYLE